MRSGFTDRSTHLLPRLVPALIRAGLMQVLVPRKVVARGCGRQAGARALVIAAAAGMLPPGGLTSVPRLDAAAHVSPA